MIKMILDDSREFPENGGYTCVRTYKDCVLLLSVFRSVDFISLDYDISEEHTGYDVLVFMHENNIKVDHINIHSNHQIGIPIMEKYVMENFPNTKLTKNSLNIN